MTSLNHVGLQIVLFQMDDDRKINEFRLYLIEELKSHLCVDDASPDDIILFKDNILRLFIIGGGKTQQLAIDVFKSFGNELDDVQ